MVASGWLSVVVFLAVFALVGGVGLYVVLRLEADRLHGLRRLRELPRSEASAPASVSGWRGLLGWVERLVAFRPPAGGVFPQTPTPLQRRLMRAGLYKAADLRTFLAVRALLTVTAAVAVGVLPGVLGLVPTLYAVTAGSLVAGVGFVAPGLWVDFWARAREAELRRGFPDALDMLVLCLEGGVSLPAALDRVTAELRAVYPQLGAELDIIQREEKMGLTVGEAVAKFADRTGLAAARDLGTILLQAERYGSGVARALRIHADTAREERQQHAEEMAQKAAVKILFPTLLCIFPAIFVVILGPAAFQIAGMLSQTK